MYQFSVYLSMLTPENIFPASPVEVNTDSKHVGILIGIFAIFAESIIFSHRKCCATSAHLQQVYNFKSHLRFLLFIFLKTCLPKYDCILLCMQIRMQNADCSKRGEGRIGATFHFSGKLFGLRWDCGVSQDLQLPPYHTDIASKELPGKNRAIKSSKHRDSDGGSHIKK